MLIEEFAEIAVVITNGRTYARHDKALASIFGKAGGGAVVCFDM